MRAPEPQTQWIHKHTNSGMPSHIYHTATRSHVPSRTSRALEHTKHEHEHKHKHMSARACHTWIMITCTHERRAHRLASTKPWTQRVQPTTNSRAQRTRAHKPPKHDHTNDEHPNTPTTSTSTNTNTTCMPTKRRGSGWKEEEDWTSKQYFPLKCGTLEDVLPSLVL